MDNDTLTHFFLTNF